MRQPTPTDRTSDEDVGGQDICQVAVRRSEAGQTGGVPKLVGLGGDIETQRQESLREAGTRSGPDEVKTAVMGD